MRDNKFLRILAAAVFLFATFNVAPARGADLTITVANVVPVSGYTAEAGYLAGATITRGQTVYLDSTTSTWKLADVDASAAAAGSAGIGISLSDVVSGQPMLVQVAGDLGLGAILTAGTIYVVSDTAGGIMPAADLDSGDRVTILGVASSTSNLKLRVWASGASF